jgi:hypothetical protein
MRTGDGFQKKKVKKLKKPTPTKSVVGGQEKTPWALIISRTDVKFWNKK